MQLNRTRSLRRIDIDHAPYLSPIWLNPDSRITNSGRQVDPDPQATPSDYDPVRAKSRQRAGPDPRVRFSARASRPARITNSGRQVDPDPQATPSDYDPVRAKSRQRAGPDPRVRFSARASRPALTRIGKRSARGAGEFSQAAFFGSLRIRKRLDGSNPVEYRLSRAA